MSLNATPASERLHIGIFGKRNAGKSSLINALTGQNLAIVSDINGSGIEIHGASPAWSCRTHRHSGT